MFYVYVAISRKWRLKIICKYCAVQAAMAGAVLLGLAMAEVGVSIQHDANHGAYLPRTWWSWLMAATLDAVRGLSMLQPATVMAQLITTCCWHHAGHSPALGPCSLTMKLQSGPVPVSCQHFSDCSLLPRIITYSSRGPSERSHDTLSLTRSGVRAREVTQVLSCNPALTQPESAGRGVIIYVAAAARGGAPRIYKPGRRGPRHPRV